MKHALVLGGTGFIGSALVKYLLHQNLNISCLIHKRSPEWNIDHVGTYYGSINSFDWSLFDSYPLDVIFHLARISRSKNLTRKIAASKNAKANKRIIRWLSVHPNPPLLVLVAGTLAYGSHEKAVTENTSLEPESYAKEYSKGEQPILNAIKNLPIMIMRPGWVYGQGSWLERFYLKPMQEKNIIPIYGDGSNWMSCIHVNDCARMIYFLAEHGAINESYNLFCGSPLLQIDFVEFLSQLTGMNIKEIEQQEIMKKYGQAAADAFRFSLKVSTKHKDLYKQFNFAYPSISKGLMKVLSGV